MIETAPWDTSAPETAPWDTAGTSPPSQDSGLIQFGKGAVQGGILDLPEQLGQIVEHMTGLKLAPDFIREKLKSFRSGVEQSDWGETGRLTGAVGSFFLPFGAAARGIGLLPKTAELVRASEVGLEGLRGELFGAGKIGQTMARGAKAEAREAGTVAKEDAIEAAIKRTGTGTRFIPKSELRAIGREAEAAHLKQAGIEGMTVRGLPQAGKELERLANRQVGRQVAKKAIAGGAMAGALGGVGTPTDPDKDFGQQKITQVLTGAFAGGLLGSPIASPTLAALAAQQLIHRIGFGNAAALAAGIGVGGAGFLGHHHGLIGPAVRATRKTIDAIIKRPEAQYATGRAAATAAGPVTSGFIEDRQPLKFTVPGTMDESYGR